MKELHGYFVHFTTFELIDVEENRKSYKFFVVAYNKTEAIKKIKAWWTNYKQRDINTIEFDRTYVASRSKYGYKITEERYQKENKLVYA